LRADHGEAIPPPIIAAGGQRAPPALLDLLEHVAGSASDAPILLIGLARPELLDERPGWGPGAPGTTPVALEPLGEDECARLVRKLLGGAGPPAEVLASIAERAGGNPLFVESWSPS